MRVPGRILSQDYIARALCATLPAELEVQGHVIANGNRYSAMAVAQMMQMIAS